MNSMTFYQHWPLTFSTLNLPTQNATQVNAMLDNTKLLFFQSPLRSSIGVRPALSLEPSLAPLGGSTRRNMMDTIAIKPMNGETRSPHLQSETFPATSDPTI